MSETILIYTDASIYPNPGPGSMAWLALYKGREIGCRARYGQGKRTTVNRLEMWAAMDALGWLHDLAAGRRLEDAEVVIVTDSEYLRDGYDGQSWRRGGPNRDLWKKLHKLADRGLWTTEFLWIPGHEDDGDEGNQWNDYVDWLAGQARRLEVDVL